MSQKVLGKWFRKRIQKNIENGARVPAGRRLASGPLAEAGLARKRTLLPPRVRARARDGRSRRAAVASRQSSAAAWRLRADLDTPWSATRCAWPRPPLPTLPFAPVGSSSLALSRPSSSSRATARHCRRHSDLLFFVAPTSFFESTATNDPASPPRTPRALNCF